MRVGERRDAELLRGAVRGSALAVVAVALLALIGWATELHALATLWPDAIPMAPSTACAFLGTALVVARSGRVTPTTRLSPGLLLVLLVVLGVALLALLPSQPLEALLQDRVGENRAFYGFPLAVMSTATAVLFATAALSLIARGSGKLPGRKVSALGGVALAAAGLVILLGYAFREPLFQASQTVIPVSPATGVAFSFTGLAIVAAAGADTWPANAFLGCEVRHRLLRAFFPVTAGLVLLVAWAMAWVAPTFRGNSAIAAAALTGISLLLITVVTSRVSAAIGAVLERSERDRSAAQAGEVRANARADTILACAGEGICGVDGAGVITSMNPAGAQLFGTAPAALCGVHHGELFHAAAPAGTSQERAQDATPPLDGDPVTRCAICRSLADQERQARDDVTLRRPDGSTFPARLVSSPILQEDEVGVVVSFADRTEQRELERQLRQAQKLEAIGSLAGGVAHDFNNLLAVILSYSHLIQRESELSDRARDDLQQIVNAANRAARLTGQLLAFSRQQVLQPKVLQPDEVIRGVEKMVSRIIGEDIDLALALAPDIGAIRVDPGQLEQILMNLVVNARDALPRGGRITIETANVELDSGYTSGHLDTQPGRYVMVAVSDNGVGMDVATQARIFEPFFTTKEIGRGTGLGLSTVFGIVKQSGGHIWVYSEPGHGTTFKLYFPRIDRPVERPKPVSQTPAGGNERILLVEDEPALREAMARVLEDGGYTVTTASNGANALASIADGAVDLVVTDIVMPEMGGPELVQRLRERHPELRALYTSGYTDRVVVREAILEEHVTFLQKPFTPGGLRQKVREALDP